ncbi:MAG: acetyl-CoA carboxylase biotin carboxyl carrier protein subunit [Fibrobacteraceae bacterium]
MKKTLRISFEGKSYDVEVEVLDNNGTAQSAPAFVASASVAAPAPAPAAAPVAAAPAGGTPVKSPMIGLVSKLKVHVGDKVANNQEIIVLEAMKMETPVYAPAAGTIAAISVKEQDSVTEGQILMTIA